MAKLALITAKTYIENVSYIDDIAGVFNDNHTFTDKEKKLFNIYQVEGSKEDVESNIPEVKQITKAKTVEWTAEQPEIKRVWKGSDGKFREVKKMPKYSLCIRQGEVKENYSLIIENLGAGIVI